MAAIPIDQIHRTPSAKPLADSWSVSKMLLWLIPMLVVFLNGADFHGADPEDNFSVHWQILMRLALTGVCGLVGAFFLFPVTYRDFLTWPGLLVVALIGSYGVSQIYSIVPNYTFVALLCYICVALTIPAAMRLLGAQAYLSSVLAGCVAFIVGSWIAYLFFPEIGVHREQVSETEFVERMGGLGHPNALGAVSMLTVVMVAGMAKSRMLRWDLAATIVIVSSITLLTCYSRTSMICCLIGLLVIFRRDLMNVGNLATLGVLGGIGTLLALVLVGSGNLDWYLEDIAGNVSKSGHVDELTTATGRTDIWAAALEFIAASPITGYGYLTQRFYMGDYSFHSHNMVLNATLSAGVGGGMVMLTIILVLLKGVLFKPRLLIDGLAVCMIVAGFVEGVIGQPAPAAPDVIWLSLIFWRQVYPEGD